MVVPQRALDLASAPDSLSDLSFRALSEAICDGTLEAGETLRVDELRSWLGVSRTPIREALARLSALGLVATQPGRYTKVAYPDVTVHAETVELLGFQGGHLLRMTVGHLSEAEMETAIAHLDTIEAAATRGDSVVWCLSIRRFLEHLWDVADNSVARRVMGDLPLVIAANIRHAEVVPTDPSERQKSFSWLRQALIYRDPDAAERAFRQLYPARTPRAGELSGADRHLAHHHAEPESSSP